MKNIYTPGDIERIVDATLGRLDDIAELDTQRQNLWFERRRVFVEQVGRQVALEVDEFRGSSKAEIIIFAAKSPSRKPLSPTSSFAKSSLCAPYKLANTFSDCR